MKATIEKVLGPPGTGKTSYLIRQVEKYLQEGGKPELICFCSFTRKAVDEAKGRAMEKFKLVDTQLPYFRTIHSLAFQQLNLEPRQVMSYNNYIDICKLMQFTISSQKFDEDGFQIIQTKGDRLLFLENMIRTTKQTPEVIFSKFLNDDLNIEELKVLIKVMADYKEIQGKLDFTDMITKFVEQNKFPEIELFIIDEAQDLSTIQWDMIRIIAKRARKVIIAGDDDQAIYAWAGADVNTFLDVTGTQKVLTQSYRIPESVFEVASRIISKINKRAKKEYIPRSEKGMVSHIHDFEGLDMSKGTWLLVARNIFLLGDYAHYCTKQGYLYYSRFGSPIDLSAAEAINTWETLRRHKEVSAEKAKVLYTYMKTRTAIKWGSKELLERLPDREFVTLNILTNKFGLLTMEPWWKALGKLSPECVDYFKRAFERKEQISDRPRIVINTIHGVKGAEADNVVLMTDMSKRTYDEMQRHADDELRVWYVGVTRTRQNLYILHPTTKYFIDL